jgi:hypothetical protein
VTNGAGSHLVYYKPLDAIFGTKWKQQHLLDNLPIEKRKTLPLLLQVNLIGCPTIPIQDYFFRRFFTAYLNSAVDFVSIFQLSIVLFAVL